MHSAINSKENNQIKKRNTGEFFRYFKVKRSRSKEGGAVGCTSHM